MLRIEGLDFGTRMVPITGLEPVTLSLTKGVLYHLSYMGVVR